MNIKNSKKILIFILLTVFYSCSGFFSHKDEPVITSELDVGKFNYIEIHDIFNIEIVQDTVDALKITGINTITKNIEIRNDNDTLKLYDKNSHNWLPNYQRVDLTINIAGLVKLTMLAPANISSKNNISSQSLTIWALGKTGEIDIFLATDQFNFVTGSDNYGHYIFKGTSRTARLWTRGSSVTRAENLLVNNNTVTNNSIGSSYVYAKEKLSVTLNSNGHIFYFGNPDEIEILEESRKGRLIKGD